MHYDILHVPWPPAILCQDVNHVNIVTFRQRVHLSKQRGYFMAQAQEGEIATKRVALTPGTWATLSRLRKPGETFDETIAGLITDHQRLQLIADLEDIDAMEKTVSWKKAKKDLGLK
jgi:hypothetical protein